MRRRAPHPAVSMQRRIRPGPPAAARRRARPRCRTARAPAPALRAPAASRHARRQFRGPGRGQRCVRRRPRKGAAPGPGPAPRLRSWPHGITCTVCPGRTVPVATRPQNTRRPWLCRRPPGFFDPLDRQGEGFFRFRGRDRQRFQALQQGRTPVAAPARRRLDDVPALQGRDRHHRAGVQAGSFAETCSAASMRPKASAGSGTASSLFTANTIDGTRSRWASRAWRCVCGNSGGSPACQGSLVASTSTTTASAAEAAVTMLRVYCSWPGASPMMNLRAGVAK